MIYENRKFASRDMLALLKNLDGEISHYETMLIDEIEKRKKYKVRNHCCNQCYFFLANLDWLSIKTVFC